MSVVVGGGGVGGALFDMSGKYEAYAGAVFAGDFDEEDDDFGGDEE